MNGIRDVSHAWALVLGSRMDAQLARVEVIFSMMLPFLDGF